MFYLASTDRNGRMFLASGSQGQPYFVNAKYDRDNHIVGFATMAEAEAERQLWQGRIDRKETLPAILTIRESL